MSIVSAFPAGTVTPMNRIALLLLLTGIPVAAAENPATPVGLWKTVDDQTGETKSMVRIVESRGVVSGRIEQVLRKGVKPDAVCRKCDDDRRLQPIVGLEIIRGARRVRDTLVWDDGEILQPESGRTFKVRLTPIHGGRELEVRASRFGIGRTQVWKRVVD